MVKPAVFIPSRGRWFTANRTANDWRSQGFVVNFMVEPAEFSKYDEALTNEYDLIHELPLNNMGVGYARHHLVKCAAADGYKAVVIADDDFRPKRRINEIFDYAQNDKVLGITARYGYHDLVLGPAIKNRDDLILLPAVTMAVYGLNIHNALKLGNYDPDLNGLEDVDMVLRGLQAGFPWMIHLGTHCTSVNKRYAPGGVSSYMKIHGIELDDVPPWYDKLYAKWPDFVYGHTTRKIRIGWRKAYNEFIPCWKDYSSLHGGDLEKYFDGC